MLNFKKILLLIALIIFPLLHHRAISQNEKIDTRLPVTMNLSYNKINGVESVKVKVCQKSENNDAPVMGPIVNLYLNKVMKHNQQTGLGWIGDYNLTRNGEALFELTNGLKYITRGKTQFTFICRMLSDQQYENKEDTLVIKNANIVIRFTEKDSKKYVTAKLTEWKDTLTELPVQGVELKLFIKNNLSVLPVKHELPLTDKNGEVSAQLPLNISGNDKDPALLVAMIENNENFGTIEASKEIPDLLPPSIWSSIRNASGSLIATCGFAFVCISSLVFYFSKSKNR